MKTMNYFTSSKMTIVSRLVFFFLAVFKLPCFAQFSISGVINTYTKVLAINPACNSVTVANTAGFFVGSRVLIIQMKGANIDVTNTANFGNITAINNAGNYEIAEIAGISGFEIYFKNTLLKSYSPAGLVQLVSVPQYTDVNITGLLTAQPWNAGTGTGGILIFEASGTVNMFADIDVSSLGFTGGGPSVNGGSCVFGSTPNYTYPATSSNSGIKGEGIAIPVTGSEGGRGKQANGGGGGNNHNNGGGGGGNYGAGGQGGNKSSGCSAFYPKAPGQGGVSLASYYSNGLNKIFLGGGGGGGHQNNNLARAGGDGGGIVIIKANTINGNNHKIISQGDSVGYNEIDHGDGNGGGGAGGTVLLQVNNYTSSLYVDVKGGAGGWTNGGGVLDRYFGPGGGGGGGVIWMNNDNALVIKNFSGGNSGWSTTHNSSYGAVAGTNGALLTGLSIPESNTLFTPPCFVTPVSLVAFRAIAHGTLAKLYWTVAFEKDNLYFTLERSNDMIHWQHVTDVQSVNSPILFEYKYTDLQPLSGTSYYRLSHTDVDGSKKILSICMLMSDGTEGRLIQSVFPNPVKNELTIYTNYSEFKPFELKLFNSTGIQILSWEIFPTSGSINIDISNLGSGTYLLYLSDYHSVGYCKIIKE